jgi:drug/metabolite transporter (DMT)-like permease
MRWERWLAALIGLAGVLIVVAPKLAGSGGIYTLVMLASSPVFAASFLLTKGLTRYERATVIVVWQSIAVSLFSMPLALTVWKMPGAAHWFGFLLCGVLGSLGHYCLTRSFTIADISATQSVKFLDLVWATVMGWLVFADHPNRSTIIGGVVICASTLWIARREARTTARIA